MRETIDGKVICASFENVECVVYLLGVNEPPANTAA
jgi:hypothetical protein